MKKIILLLTLLFLAAPLYAQHSKGDKGKHVEEMVSNLSAKQKRQLEAIDNEQRAKIAAVKAELKQVRDSVHVYIDMYGDHSKKVNHLLEREAALQLKMNKMRYATKVKIDKVLTPEQHREMRARMEQCRPKDRKKAGK